MNIDTGNGNGVKTLEIDDIHNNTGTEIIQITSEKLKLILVDHEKEVGLENSWQTPLGIFLTIVLVLFTADFKESFGLSPDFWMAVFSISAALSAFWTLVSYNKRRKSKSVDEIMDKIKNRQ